MGFEIYTIKKPNINSWFCNKIVNNPNENNYDFIISNLHWGTRWSYFKKYNLNCYPKILIDGDDNHSNLSWKEKYATYKHKYEVDPSENLKDKKLSSFRWVENMHDYLPDIVFTTQKKITDNCYYLPIGIKRDYFAFYENKSTEMREYDFTHIDGHGIRRKKMHWFLRICHLLKILPGKIFNGSICGASIVPELIEKQVENDKNREESKSMIKPFKNTKRILKSLKKKYHLAIISNNPHKEVLNILKLTKIDKKLFEVIIGDDEVKKAKPFPDEIYAAEKKFKKKVEFMVGDTIQDIKTAKAAKVKSIIIKQGPKQTWKKLKSADFIIKDITELPNLIKEIK